MKIKTQVQIVPKKLFQKGLDFIYLFSAYTHQPPLSPIYLQACSTQSFLIVHLQGLRALNNGDPTSSLALGSLLPASSFIFPRALVGQAMYI